jgi:hypothetical protein
MDKELTFGEKAVGRTFNPGSILEVDEVKLDFANIIDTLNDMRTESGDAEVKRMLSLAITDAQTAQMWAVKAITWKS